MENEIENHQTVAEVQSSDENLVTETNVVTESENQDSETNIGAQSNNRKTDNSNDNKSGKQDPERDHIAENKAVDMANGMTEEQCDALEELCRVRHEIQATKIDRIFTIDFEDEYITEEFENRTEIEERIKSLFGVYPWIRQSYRSEIDWDNMCDDEQVEYEQRAMEEYPDGTRDGSSVFYDDAIESITAAKKEVISDIEKFFKNIDKQFGTQFAPTGSLR